ncbi:MAG: hypothetical protein IH991_14605 [Planctomycetes bacterium]|nr:hypothetical protein [Planctomycetota bacterium]
MILLAGSAEQFKPTATYDPDGDCIEFLAKPDPFYAERIDDLVTVYYSQETDEVIGSLIKGASKFCNEMLKRMPGFRIEIQAGRVSLQHFFLARLWSEVLDPDDLHSLTYRKLLQCWFVVECVREPCKKGKAATSRRTPKITTYDHRIMAIQRV